MYYLEEKLQRHGSRQNRPAIKVRHQRPRQSDKAQLSTEIAPRCFINTRCTRFGTLRSSREPRFAFTLTERRARDAL